MAEHEHIWFSEILSNVKPNTPWTFGHVYHAAATLASLCFPAARTHRSRLLGLHRPSRPSLAPAGNPPSPTCTERLAAGPGRAHVMICRSGGGGATSDAAVPVGETADSRTLSPPAQGTSPHLERPPGARRNAAAPPHGVQFYILLTSDGGG